MFKLRFKKGWLIVTVFYFTHLPLHFYAVITPELVSYCVQGAANKQHKGSLSY